MRVADEEDEDNNQRLIHKATTKSRYGELRNSLRLSILHARSDFKLSVEHINYDLESMCGSL